MSRYTQRAIVQSFMTLIQTKSFDKITVKEIIEAANINRNTFYYHYQDIYDLLYFIFEIAADRFRHETVIDHTFFESCKRAAETLQVNRNAIIHIYNSAGRDELIHFLHGAAVHFVKGFVEKDAERTRLSQSGKEFIVSFYSYSLMGVALRWIECRMPDYRVKVIETFSESYGGTVREMIRTYIAWHREECR